MSHRKKRQRVASSPVTPTNPTDDALFEAPTGKDGRNKDQQNRSLFVTSLAPETTNDDLTELFSQSFPIKHATAVLDIQTKKCRGYGFVTFADPDDAVRAKEEYDGSVLLEHTIKVEIAKPRLRGGEAGTRQSEPGQRSAGDDQIHGNGRISEYPTLPSKLIIRNLPWSIGKPEQLAALFESYGKVNKAILPFKRPGVLAGFGIVLMRGHKNAEKAIESVNGNVVDGRTVAVDWAVDRETWQARKNTVETELSGGLNDAVRDTSKPDEADSELMDSSSSGAQSEEETDKDEMEVQAAHETENSDDYSKLLFLRNIPFTATDDTLSEHFSEFGPVRYARVVLDRATERPKGTGFVCFYKSEDLDACLKGAPKTNAQKLVEGAKGETGGTRISHSILQNEEVDASGLYTMDGRVLQIARAVERSEANRLTVEGVARRFARDTDKRRLYLLSEGTIAVDSSLYQSLSPSERAMRDASAKQRKTLIESNPSLHLSLTRLSIRNIPRSVSSKELKELARKAIVGFATDVKGGRRQRLSREELQRGGVEMAEAERQRKAKAKGVVKQAKVVFESQDGGKVDESTGGGRSRGYGFIEYYTHRSALMGLRWLNGHAIDYKVIDTDGKKTPKTEIQDRKKRLIVEFAIENAQVVKRRNDREVAARETDKKESGLKFRASKMNSTADLKKRKLGQGKRVREASKMEASPHSKSSKGVKPPNEQNIIARKRIIRRKKAQSA